MWPYAVLPKVVGLQRRAGIVPHPVSQHGCALLHHACHAIGLLHLVACPAWLLLRVTAEVALQGGRQRSCRQMDREGAGHAQFSATLHDHAGGRAVALAMPR